MHPPSDLLRDAKDALLLRQRLSLGDLLNRLDLFLGLCGSFSRHRLLFRQLIQRDGEGLGDLLGRLHRRALNGSRLDLADRVVRYTGKLGEPIL
jgi:hypothetical protein